MHEQGFANLSHLTQSVVIFLLIGSATVVAANREEQIHQMAHSVVPIDTSKTLYLFKKTKAGGVQRVVAKDPRATDQAAIIQWHVKHETERFQHGDYSDPAMPHGADIAALKELQAGASHIQVSFAAALPAGAEITFNTTDRHMLTALHRWFGAHSSEHGAHARSG
jgi:hypothetical protein